MWKGLLTLLALAVVFVVILKLLERRHARKALEQKPAPKQDDALTESTAEREDDEDEAPGYARLPALIDRLVHGSAQEAKEAAQQVLLFGPGALSALMPIFHQAETTRREHSSAVVARRVEDTLAAFGPAAIRPCLELMATEKGSFEVYRGVRAVMIGIGEGAARPIVDAMPRLAEEGLYVRATLLLRALGPGVVSPLMRTIEGGDARAREVAQEVLVDVALSHAAAVRGRVREAFLGASEGHQGPKGVLASADVRLALLLALERLGGAVAYAERAALLAATRDGERRVRREAWRLVSQMRAHTPESGTAELLAMVQAAPIDSEGLVAAAQVYAHAAWGLPVAGAVTTDARVALALGGERARRGDATALLELEQALANGALETRREAAEALAFAGTEEAGRILAKGLLQTPPQLIAAVAHALGRTPPQAASASLFDLWEDRLSNAVRRGVVAQGAASIPKLLDYVARRTPRLMEGAAFALGELGADARAPLLAMFRECRAADPALFAMEIAFEAQGADAVPDLLPLLDAEAPHVRESAARILAQAGDPAAIDPLLAHLTQLADRSPVLDFVKRGGPDVHARALRFLEENPAHPDADAIREAAA